MLGQENLQWMLRWHCPPDTEFEIQALAVWGRARHLSVAEAPHNIESVRASREDIFCFFARAGFQPQSPISKQAALTTAPGPPPPGPRENSH